MHNQPSNLCKEDKTLKKQRSNIIYNPEEIEHIRLSSHIARDTLKYIAPFVQAGISTGRLNDLCHEFIVGKGANPSPLNYQGYPKSTCISVNHVVCHGIPSESKILKEGDILNIDITADKNGYFGDTSAMFTVGKPSIKASNLINTTYECLMRAIEAVKPGIDLAEIGNIIETIAHKAKFSVVRDFCGHGIGKSFHHHPQVLHYKTKDTGTILEEGMVFTIEPMINAGNYKVKVLSDGWTAVTSDKSLSAQFEHTISVTSSGYDILTN